MATVTGNHQGHCLAFSLCFYLDFLLPCLTPHRRQPGGRSCLRNQKNTPMPWEDSKPNNLDWKWWKKAEVGTNLQMSLKPQWFWFVLCTCVLFTSPSNVFRSFWWHFENRLPQEKYRSNLSNTRVRQGDLFTVSYQTAYALHNIFYFSFHEKIGIEMRKEVWFGALAAFSPTVGIIQSKTSPTKFGPCLRWCRILTCHMTQMNFHCVDLKWWGWVGRRSK